MELIDIAKQLISKENRIHLIYAFNGTGKTRLSREFIKLFPAECLSNDDITKKTENNFRKLLYYNDLTEDLFFWKNESLDQERHTLHIQENYFTSWLISFLKDQGQDKNIISNFQRYTNSNINANFSQNFDFVNFSIESGGNNSIREIKISKGEESNFIWSLIYTFLDEVSNVLIESAEDRSCHDFDEIEYIFIDDPVSSLDENHLIEIAVDLIRLIKKFPRKVKFIISTHNPFFYNVVHNTFKKSEQGILNKYILKKPKEEDFEILELKESHFSYHLHLLEEIKKAINNNEVKRYHFNFLRNVLERMAIFLGHKNWRDILPDEFKDKIASYEERLININSHSDFFADESFYSSNNARQDIEDIYKAINEKYNFSLNY